MNSARSAFAVVLASVLIFSAVPWSMRAAEAQTAATDYAAYQLWQKLKNDPTSQSAQDFIKRHGHRLPPQVVSAAQRARDAAVAGGANLRGAVAPAGSTLAKQLNQWQATGSLVNWGIGTGGAVGAYGGATVGATTVGVAAGGFAIGWGAVEALQWAWPGCDPLEQMRTGCDDPDAGAIAAVQSGQIGPVVVQDCQWTVLGTPIGSCYNAPSEGSNTARVTVKRNVTVSTAYSIQIQSFGRAGQTCQTTTQTLNTGSAGTFQNYTINPTGGPNVGLPACNSTSLVNGGIERLTIRRASDGALLADSGPGSLEWNGDMQLKTTLQCRDGDSIHNVVQTSPPYQATGGPVPPGPAASCAPGAEVISSTVTREPTSPSIAAAHPNLVKEVAGYDRPDPVTLEDGTPIAERYPECDRKPCVLWLGRIQTDGSAIPCTHALCAGWTVDPRRASRYGCYWGPYKLDLMQCAQFAESFDDAPKSGPGTEPETATPVVTKPQPDSPENPSPTDPAEPEPDPATQECGSIFSGVKCALAWAFVPSAATKAKMDGLSGRIAATPPFSIFVAFEQSLSPLLYMGSACPNWQVQVGASTFNIVCDSSYIQKLVQIRPVLLVMMILTAFSRLLWNVWYAVIPFIKVSPGSGGGDKE